MAFADKTRSKANKPPVPRGLLIFIFVSAAALVSVFAANSLFYKEFIATVESDPAVSGPGTRAWVEIDFGNGTRRAFEGVVGQNRYPAFLVLRSIAERNNIPLDIKNGSGVRVETANAPQNGEWRIYKNGERADRDEHLTIGAGERLTLKFENK